MLKRWWLTKVTYQDPSNSQLHYATRIIIAVFLSTLICVILKPTNTLWLVLATTFTSFAQLDIGYKNQIKRLFIAGILCVAGIYIGSLIGLNPWIHGLGLLLLASFAYQTIRINLATFIMFLMPLFTTVIASAHPCGINEANHRAIAALVGVSISWLCGASLFPYKYKKTISNIENALSYHFIACFNLIFLSYLTGNNRMKSARSSYDKILNLLHALNQNLICLKDIKLDQRAKQFFNLFAQAYFLARLLHEPSSPDQWLYLRDKIDQTRRDIKKLMIAWHHKDQAVITELTQQICSFDTEQKTPESKALNEAITKIALSVRALSPCNTP